MVALHAISDSPKRLSFRHSLDRVRQGGGLGLFFSYQKKPAYHFDTNELLDGAHSVRIYRNSIVHEDSEAAEFIDLQDARSILCQFFRRLPYKW